MRKSILSIFAFAFALCGEKECLCARQKIETARERIERIFGGRRQQQQQAQRARQILPRQETARERVERIFGGRRQQQQQAQQQQRVHVSEEQVNALVREQLEQIVKSHSWEQVNDALTAFCQRGGGLDLVLDGLGCTDHAQRTALCNRYTLPELTRLCEEIQTQVVNTQVVNEELEKEQGVSSVVPAVDGAVRAQIKDILGHWFRMSEVRTALRSFRRTGLGMLVDQQQRNTIVDYYTIERLVQIAEEVQSELIQAQVEKAQMENVRAQAVSPEIEEVFRAQIKGIVAQGGGTEKIRTALEGFHRNGMGVLVEGLDQDQGRLVVEHYTLDRLVQIAQGIQAEEDSKNTPAKQNAKQPQMLTAREARERFLHNQRQSRGENREGGGSVGGNTLAQRQTTFEQRIGILPDLLNQINLLLPQLYACYQINDAQNIHRADGNVMRFIRTFHDFMGTPLVNRLERPAFDNAVARIVDRTDTDQDAANVRNGLRAEFAEWFQRVQGFSDGNRQIVDTLIADFAALSDGLAQGPERVGGRLGYLIGGFQLADAGALSNSLHDISPRNNPQGGDCPPGHWTRFLQETLKSLSKNVSAMALVYAQQVEDPARRGALLQQILGAVETDLDRYRYNEGTQAHPVYVFTDRFVPRLRRFVQGVQDDGGSESE